MLSKYETNVNETFGNTEAPFEGDPSFARGFGETNRARRGLRGWRGRAGARMFHVKHPAVKERMFHVKQFARRRVPPPVPGPPRRAPGGSHRRSGAFRGRAGGRAAGPGGAAKGLVEHEHAEAQVVEGDAHAHRARQGGDDGDRGPEPPVAGAPAEESRHQRDEGAYGDRPPARRAGPGPPPSPRRRPWPWWGCVGSK